VRLYEHLLVSLHSIAEGMKRAHYRRLVPNAVLSMPCGSGLARPGSPTDTCRIRWADETDSDTSDLS
jgi:hypothetical protein